jgi:hypothetical protein
LQDLHVVRLAAGRAGVDEGSNAVVIAEIKLRLDLDLGLVLQERGAGREREVNL